MAFEADHIDPATHEGWDVVVTGEGAEITDSRDSLALVARSYAIKSWARDVKTIGFRYSTRVSTVAGSTLRSRRRRTTSRAAGPAIFGLARLTYVLLTNRRRRPGRGEGGYLACISNHFRARTPIGKLSGAFASLNAIDLGAAAIAAALERANVRPAQVKAHQ